MMRMQLAFKDGDDGGEKDAKKMGPSPSRSWTLFGCIGNEDWRGPCFGANFVDFKGIKLPLLCVLFYSCLVTLKSLSTILLKIGDKLLFFSLGLDL